MITYKLILSGKVQNVGCRQTFSRLAKELGLTGYVKNLASGDVEVVLQGDAVNIKSLLSLAKSKNSRLEFTTYQSTIIPFHPFDSFEIL